MGNQEVSTAAEQQKKLSNNYKKSNNILRPINSSQWRHIYALHMATWGHSATAGALSRRPQQAKKLYELCKNNR